MNGNVRCLFAAALLASVTACSGGLGEASRAATKPTERTVPTNSPRGRILGDFYPVLDQTDTTTLVLPSGLAVTLSGGLKRAIGGLGAAFDGLVTPKHSAVCCALSFGIDHAAPSDLFDALGPDAISTPVLVPAAHAKLDDLKQFKGEYGILSTGEWTLFVTFEDGKSGPLADATVLKRLDSWRLSSTPDGAVLEVPADSTIDQSSVGLGRSPDLSDTAIDLTEHVEPCRTKADTARTVTSAAYDDVASWCEHGLHVRIEGPHSYVERVVADLKVTVKANA